VTNASSLEKRVEQLEAREDIKELVARYGFTVDNRDMEGIADCFTENAAVLSKDGRHASRGKADVVNQYHHRFGFLGPTNHFTHNHVIWFDKKDPTKAYGLLNAHGEVFRNGNAMMSALRYDDEYRRDSDGKWRFELRMMTYFYYLRFDEIQTYLGDPMRVRAYAEPQRCDWPEGVETYRRYYEEHPRSKVAD
jgi:ketosteroid isomerase-like protein